MSFSRPYTVADFFSGCGGLSLGFSLTGRFDVALGCDIKPEAVETFVMNHEGTSGPPVGVLDDIKVLSSGRVREILRKFGASEVGALDCLIGGPPCEGFSQNRSIGSGGKSQEGVATRVSRFIDDPRNDLFRWFVDLAKELQPRVVLIENVPDLVRHKEGDTLREVLAALEGAGYVASVKVLNAADYGVPQMRRRAFFLAQRASDLAQYGLRLELPKPTHKPFPLHNGDLETNLDWLPGDSGYWPNVREAIGDLPPARESDDFDHTSRAYPTDVRVTGLRTMLRTKDGSVPYNHLSRKLGKNGLEKVLALKKGQRAADLPDELRPRNYYHYSYSRLKWAEPARTITKFCYHVGSGMFAHPEEDRAVTMREAARLQTFPDDFRFYSDNIREISAMVGSAVPPILATAIARQVVQYLDQLTLLSLGDRAKMLVHKQATDAVLRRLEREEWGTKDGAAEQMGLKL